MTTADRIQAAALRLAARRVGIDEAVRQLVALSGRDRGAVEEARRRCEEDDDLGFQPDIARRATLLLTALLSTGFWRTERTAATEREADHVPHLDHVALPVRDPVRSLAFYRDVIGVEGTVREEPYGYVITTPAGVAFTLFSGEPAADPGALHLGVSLDDPGAVRGRRSELHEQGVPEIEWHEEPGYVSVKVTDPDGYVIELSWDEKHRPG